MAQKQNWPLCVETSKHSQLFYLLQHIKVFWTCCRKNPQQAGIKDEARTNPLDRCTFCDLNSILTVHFYHLKDVLAQVVNRSQTIISLSVSHLSQHEFPGLAVILQLKLQSCDQLMKNIILERTFYIFSTYSNSTYYLLQPLI